MTATRMHGVMIGLVKDVDDPDGDGRVRVAFPWLGSDELSGWAPVATPLAGKDRGFWYMPEIDDEALVAFEQDDVDHPFILGFLHNGVDKPPTDGIDKHVRRIKSVSGHVVDLDDRSGDEKVHVLTNGGHKLDLRDNDSTIEITTAGGQTVTMTDSPAQVQLKTTGGASVTMTDAPSQIEVKTAGGVMVTISDTGITVTSATAPVTVNALSADITAASEVTVTAPAISLDGAAVTVNSAMATFSGVVTCSTLIATSVVSSSYTPGVGNIW
jgi:uncharacterized protein involved in type VI secretion and phage assembly